MEDCVLLQQNMYVLIRIGMEMNISNIGYPLLDKNSKVSIQALKSFLKGNEKKETREK